VLRLPERARVTSVHFTAKGIERVVRVHPGERIPLRFAVPAGGEWTLHFEASKPGYLGDRAVSVHAPRVRFRRSP
jgi:hypothetical protein